MKIIKSFIVNLLIETLAVLAAITTLFLIIGLTKSLGINTWIVLCLVLIMILVGTIKKTRNKKTVIKYGNKDQVTKENLSDIKDVIECEESRQKRLNPTALIDTAETLDLHGGYPGFSEHD